MPVERVSERGRIVEAPGDGDSLGAEGGSTLSRGMISQRPGQAGHQTDTERRCFSWKRLECRFEKRNQVDVVVRAGPHMATSVPERRVGLKHGEAGYGRDCR